MENKHKLVQTWLQPKFQHFSVLLNWNENLDHRQKETLQQNIA